MTEHHPFADTFKPNLSLPEAVKAANANELEQALIVEDPERDDGLLYRLHKCLLEGVNQKRKPVDRNNWVKRMCNKVQEQWDEYSLGNCPLTVSQMAQPSEAAEGYRELPAHERIRLLHVLCEMRLDQSDLKTAIDGAMRASTRSNKPKKPKANNSAKANTHQEPPATSNQGHEQAQGQKESKNNDIQQQQDQQQKERDHQVQKPAQKKRTAEDTEAARRQLSRADDLRRRPLGMDSSGNAYHLLRLDAIRTHRVIKEERDASVQLLASSSEEASALAKWLSASRSHEDGVLAGRLELEAVTSMRAEERAQEQRAKAKRRVRARLGDPDSSLPAGRQAAKRARMALSSSFASS